MRRRSQIVLALAVGGAAALTWTRTSRVPRVNFRGKTVVITGGSRGLGLELARAWGAQGARVAICARTPADLQVAEAELRRRGYDVYAHVCDVTQAVEVTWFIEAVRTQFGAMDVLVNNAGIIQAGPLECMTLADYRAAMDTHFWAPLHAIQAVLPCMRKQGAGRIVNIASIGGKVSVPHLTPYCASKFALTGLSEGLRHELAADNIFVTTVCPGLMRTGSPRNADFKGQHRAEYAWFSISDSLPGLSMNSERAAHQIIEACRRGDAEIVLSLPAALASRVHGLFPGFTAAALRWVNGILPGANGAGTESKKGSESFSRWSPSWLTTLGEQAALENNEL